MITGENGEGYLSTFVLLTKPGDSTHDEEWRSGFWSSHGQAGSYSGPEVLLWATTPSSAF